MKRFLEQITPYLTIGILCALVVVIFIFIVHVIVWGLLIGLVLYAFFAIKNYFFPPPKENDQPGKRIIDHDDKEL